MATGLFPWTSPTPHSLPGWQLIPGGEWGDHGDGNDYDGNDDDGNDGDGNNDDGNDDDVGDRIDDNDHKTSNRNYPNWVKYFKSRTVKSIPNWGMGI